MNTAGIGMRTHSDWGALVVVSGDASELQILDRRRVIIADPQIPGAKQPYHFAAQMDLPEAEVYIHRCWAASESLARIAMADVIRELSGRNHHVTIVAVLLASGRPLPALSGILASHALIHAAEGDFFRQAFSKACERLGLHVTRIREKQLDEQAKATLGPFVPDLQRRIAGLRQTLGSPWTEDYKRATLAATIGLSSGKEQR